MERLLSDALTRADFGKDVTDRDVLKSLLKGLTATQAATMARMPRERLLSTVAAHRESHRVAHEALARLGTVLEQLGTTKLSDLTNATTPDDTAAAAAGGEEEAAAEKVEVDVGGKAEKFVDPEAGDDEVVEEEDAEDAAEFGVEAAVAEAMAGDGDTGQPDVDVAALEKDLIEGLNETLSSFAIPLEMLDEEVVRAAAQQRQQRKQQPSHSHPFLPPSLPPAHRTGTRGVSRHLDGAPLLEGTQSVSEEARERGAHEHIRALHQHKRQGSQGLTTQHPSTSATTGRSGGGGGGRGGACCAFGAESRAKRDGDGGGDGARR